MYDWNGNGSEDPGGFFGILTIDKRLLLERTFLWVILTSEGDEIK